MRDATAVAPSGPADGTASRAPLGPIWLFGVLALAGILSYALWALNGGLVREGNWIGVDFHVYYQAAMVLRRGEDVYAAGISPPYVYPPLLAALVIPLSLLNITAATIVWKVLQHVCLLVAGGVLVAMLPRGVRPLAAGLLLFGLMTVPLRDEIQVGESNSLVLALVAGALWFAWRATLDEHPSTAFSLAGVRVAPPHIAAGALLGLAAGIKVLPVLLVAYFWWRGPRGVALAATVLFLLLQAVQLIFVPSAAGYWLVQFPALFGQAFPFLDNQSLNAFVARAVVPVLDPSTNVIDAEALRPWLTWGANLLVLAGSVIALRRSDVAAWASHPRGGAVRLLLEAGLVLLTTNLVSGSTWLHHLVALAVPLCGLLGAWWLALPPGPLAPRAWLTPFALAVAVAALALRPGDLAYAAGSGPLSLAASSWAMWLVIVLWVAVARSLPERGRGELRLATY
jgi:hypothetical protein